MLEKGVGEYRKLKNSIKINLVWFIKWNDMGDLYFMKNGEEADIPLMKKVQQYVIDIADKKKLKQKLFLDIIKSNMKNL